LFISNIFCNFAVQIVKKQKHMSKIIIYQLLPRLFSNFNTTRKNNGTIEENGCGKFNLISAKALREIKHLGATHVWYTGVIEHATQTDYTRFGIQKDHPAVVKGLAGSPYAIKDYYDVDPDLAEDVPHRMDEWLALVERTHKAGLKVIMDFVPNHVARQYHSDAKPKGVRDLGEDDNPQWEFSPLNNFSYIHGEAFRPSFDIKDYVEFPAKVTGNDCFSAHPSHNDWYETVKLNYGEFYRGGHEKQFNPRPNTWEKMRDILIFWAEHGADGFRCDMAEMVPVEFWEWVIPQVKETYKDLIFIAEVYKPNLYYDYLFRGHFDYLYDKVGMYDYLRGATSKNYAVEGITNCWQRVDNIKDHMLYFLENHDEQRIASGFFCGRGICAEPAMIVAATLGTNPVMIYAGQELGEQGMDVEGFSGIDGRTTIFDYWGVRSLQAWANNGKWDGAGLDDEQRTLREFYCRLLTIAQKEKAISEGKMYDLEYAQAEGFNKHEQFAYLRHYAGKNGKSETLLIVLNFDDHAVEVGVRIPQEAFGYLSIEQRDEVTMTDLLTGQEMKRPLMANKPVSVSLPAWTGVILKVTNKNK